MTFTTEFGFLNEPISLDADGILVRPCDDFEATASAVRSQLNPDGYFYPPTSETFRFPRWPDMTHREPVPQTKRPAHLFDMPMSHVLTLSASGSEEALLDEATFVVQALAYLYGTRLQPDGWQLDARVPVTHSTHPVHVGTAALHRFVPRALAEWRAQPTERRLRLTNVLYLHAKAPSYEWIWEQFLMEYVVLDAIYDYSFRAGTATLVLHAERIRELCGRCGLWCPVDAPVEALVTMRNTLFHEGLWEGERPGYKISAEAYNRGRDLRHLTQRLIAATLAGASEYTRSRWADRSQYMFFS